MIVTNLMEKDPRGYLETDARIVAEDDQYVAIVLRIQKTLLARNLALLAALADHVSVAVATVT